MRIAIKILITAALFTVAQGCQQQGRSDPVLDPLPVSGLAAGDRVRVVVFQQEDLSGEFTLDADATLAMPLVGDIPARGLTTQALQREIVDRLTPDYLRDPKVTVDRLSLRPVYLLGEVKQPGSYEHSESLSVAKAVALAGGLTYRASEQRITIRRVDSNGQTHEFRADMNTPVQGGDLIQIRERFF